MKKPPAPSPEDADLWEKITRDIKPLAKDDGAPVPEVETPLRVRADKTKPGKAPSRTATRTPAKAPQPLPDMTHGTAAGLDRRTAARLRRGQLAIEARIDLHGMTQAEAHPALEDFLERTQAGGKRCVIVITGKGLRADGRIGVLRTMVPRWLNDAPNRGRIIAFNHAQPKDGGEGALYVLLKKRL